MGHPVPPVSMGDKLATPDLPITKTTMVGLASIVPVYGPVIEANDMKAEVNEMEVEVNEMEVEARDTASQEGEDSLH